MTVKRVVGTEIVVRYKIRLIRLDREICLLQQQWENTGHKYNTIKIDTLNAKVNAKVRTGQDKQCKQNKTV